MQTDPVEKRPVWADHVRVDVTTRCKMRISTLHFPMMPTTCIAPTSLEGVAVTGARNRALARVNPVKIRVFYCGNELQVVGGLPADRGLLKFSSSVKARWRVISIACPEQCQMTEQVSNLVVSFSSHSRTQPRRPRRNRRTCHLLALRTAPSIPAPCACQ